MTRGVPFPLSPAGCSHPQGLQGHVPSLTRARSFSHVPWRRRWGKAAGARRFSHFFRGGRESWERAGATPRTASPGAFLGDGSPAPLGRGGTPRRRGLRRRRGAGRGRGRRATPGAGGRWSLPGRRAEPRGPIPCPHPHLVTSRPRGAGAERGGECGRGAGPGTRRAGCGARGRERGRPGGAPGPERRRPPPGARGRGCAAPPAIPAAAWERRPG